MEIGYSYHNIYGEKVLIKEYSGQVKLDDVINSWEETLSKDILKPHTKGVLTNYLNANLEFSRDDVKSLLSYFKKKGVFKSIRFALLMDNPEQVVFPILAGQDTAEFYSKPFCTEEAATKWIMAGTR